MEETRIWRDDPQGGRRLALVTGASSGIGRAFARRLAEAGWDLIIAGRRQDRLDGLAADYPGSRVRSLVVDLAHEAGAALLAEICEAEPLDLLVNNAGVSHYMPFVDLPVEKLSELLHVKVLTPTLLARAAARGMVARGRGAIVNVSGMLAFAGPVPLSSLPLRRAVYAGALAHLVAFSMTLDTELKPAGVRVQALCPGVVATEFHERQGLDLSAVPRMSAEDVVAASLTGLDLGEVVCAPGVDRDDLLGAMFQAQIAAFAAQSPELAGRYRSAAGP